MADVVQLRYSKQQLVQGGYAVDEDSHLIFREQLRHLNTTPMSNEFNAPFTPNARVPRIGSERPARDPYSMRTLSVDFRPDPQPDSETDFMFQLCCR